MFGVLRIEMIKEAMRLRSNCEREARREAFFKALSGVGEPLPSVPNGKREDQLFLDSGEEDPHGEAGLSFYLK